jgi:hypothetical protein
MAESSNGSGIRQKGKRKMKTVKELFQDIKWFAVALCALAFIREGGEA